MSVSAINQKIAASTSAGQTEACSTCPSAGLPILLTRYGIDPKGRESTPPKFQSGYEPPKLISAGRQLRVLREGFVYVALQYDSAPDKVFWMCYLVDSAGLLKEIPVGAPAPEENKLACNRKEHSVNAALIAIPAPEFVHTAHLAFTELQWTQSTLDDYEQIILGKQGAPDTGRSIERFVALSPKAWVPDGGDLSPAPNVWAYPKVFNVVEYQAALSDLDAQTLENTTGFPCKPRRNAKQLVDRMNALRMGRGMVLALPDPLGEVKELNVVRMDAWHAYRAYSNDEDLQWKAQSAQLIEGIKAGAAKLAKEQTEAATKNRKRRPRVRGGSKEVNAYYLNRALKPIKGEYDERAQAEFLLKYYDELDKRAADVVDSDSDYVAALSAPQQHIVLSDFDHSVIGHVGFTVAMAPGLAGGGVTDVSLNWWRQSCELDETDPYNYALRVSLGDHAPIIAALKLSESDLFNWLWEQDSSSRAKANDIVRGALLSDTMKAQYFAAFTAAAGNTLNTLEALKRRYDVGKSKVAVGSKRVSKALSVSKLQMSKGSYVRLARLQKNLMRAFATYSSGLHTVSFSVTNASPKEVFLYAEAFGERNVSVMSNHLSMRKLKPGEQGAKPGHRFKIESNKVFHASMKDYVLNDAQLAKVQARGSGGVDFAIMGTRAELDELVTELLIKDLDIDTKIAAKVAGTAKAIAVVESKAAARIAALRHLPQRLSEAQVADRVVRLGAHARKVSASFDVGLTGFAIFFNYWHLSNMTRALIEADAFDTDEARVAFVSGVFGAAGVSVEAAGKLGQLVKAFDGAGAKATGSAANAAVQQANGALARFGATRLGAGMVARAGVLIGIGSLLGSFAVALDSVQMGMVAKDAAGAGDTDAMMYSGASAAFFTGASVALFASAGAEGGIAALSGVYTAVEGLTALAWMTPITAGLVLLGIGVLFAYLAFTAKDKPLTTWIKRSRFGDDERNRFKSMEAELGALQLVNLAFEIHLRWDDRPISDIVFGELPEEVEITIEYPANARGTLVYGLVVSGAGGRACFTPVGVGALDVNTVDLPRVFDARQCPRYNSGTEMPVGDADGGGYNEATMVITGTSLVSGDEVKQNGGIQRQGAGVEEANRISDSDLSGLKQDETHRITCKVVHTWQIDADRFDTAELHIRYFPDASEPKKFVDSVYSVRD